METIREFKQKKDGYNYLANYLKEAVTSIEKLEKNSSRRYLLLKSYINNLQDRKTKDTICNGGTVWHKYKFESKPLRLVNFEVDEYEVVRNG